MRMVLGLSPLQWISLLVCLLALFVTTEAWLGHFRSGFSLRVQYAPLAIGGLLACASVAAAAAPLSSLSQIGLRVMGATALITGFIGMIYHHWYGIVKEPGGYRWLLHYLMYGPPPLAPLALSVLGALALVTAHALSGSEAVLGVPVQRALLGIVALGLAGAIAQAGILHYRGAFNTPLMYAPLVLPPAAVIAVAWMAADPEPFAELVSRVSLWLTFFTGFVGLGMHLRGLDRQMGGLHVFVFNLLQGPPPLAPAMFSGLAAIGLASIELGP